MTDVSDICGKHFCTTYCRVHVAFALCVLALTNGCSNVVGPNPDDVVSISYSVSGFCCSSQIIVTDSVVRITDGIEEVDTSFVDTLFLSALVKSVNLTHAVNESDDVDRPKYPDDDAVTRVSIVYTSSDVTGSVATKNIRYSDDAPDSIRDLARLLADRQQELRRRL